MSKAKLNTAEPTVTPLPAFTLAHYEALTKLLLADDQILVGILSETTDLSESDKIAKLLFLLFESQKKSNTLMTTAIAYEIENCQKSNLLFRNNSLCSKMMTVFARLQGLEYLKAAIGKEVDEIAQSDRSFEVDPDRAQSSTDLASNIEYLLKTTNRFMDSILASKTSMPKELRMICHILQSKAVARFPESQYTVVAGFVFLRFICPAIVSPPTYALLQSFPKKDAHRGLVLVAKVLQNLANGVKFGSKETHMSLLNSFIDNYDTLFKQFVNDISNGNLEGPSVKDLQQSNAQQLETLGDLYLYLNRNIQRIQETLGETARRQQLEVVEQLKAILADMERTGKTLKPAVPAPTTNIAASGSGMIPSAASVSEKLSELPKQLSGLLPLDLLQTLSVLNTARMAWNDTVRPPVLVSVDLLNRARKLCTDHAVRYEGNNRSSNQNFNSFAVDWQELSDSVDFSEFVLDTAELQKVDLAALHGPKESLSFWLNVYNIMVIHIYVVNGPPTSRSRRKAMFVNFAYEIGGLKFSLEDLLEGVIRGNPKSHFGKKDPRQEVIMHQYDPRSHCGYSWLTASSPSVRVFKPETISIQLTLASEEFLQEQTSVIADKKKIRLPQLLKDYYQDFGTYSTDIFRWLAKYLDQQTSLEISTLLSTTHYTIEYVEHNWEPKKKKLFTDDPTQITRASAVEQFLLEFPTEATINRCRSNSTTNSSDKLDDMGVVNMEVIWNMEARPATIIAETLVRQAQGLCHLFLFDWGSIAGSMEFKAFLLCLAELQVVQLKKLTNVEALVFWINIYNVLIINLYIMKRPLAEMSVFGRKNFFSSYKYNISGNTFSLDDIYFGIIRGNASKQFKKNDPRLTFTIASDPRVLCTLSQLTKSTPVVRVYMIDNFEAALTRAAQAYLRLHVRTDAQSARVILPYYLKQIYDDDFRKKKDGMLMWVAQFLTNEQRASVESLLSNKKLALAFDDFDWTPWPVFDKSF